MLVGASAGLALPDRTDNRVTDRLRTLLASTRGQTGALSVKDASKPHRLRPRARDV